MRHLRLAGSMEVRQRHGHPQGNESSQWEIRRRIDLSTVRIFFEIDWSNSAQVEPSRCRQLLFASIRRVMDDSVAPRLRRSADGRKSGRVFATRSTTS